MCDRLVLSLQRNPLKRNLKLHYMNNWFYLQAFHCHIPNLVWALGQSHSELLQFIYDPSQGSENLLAHVLQMLTQETTPSFDLISTVNVHMILNLWMLQFLFCCCHHFLKGGFTNISSAC